MKDYKVMEQIVKNILIIREIQDVISDLKARADYIDYLKEKIEDRYLGE